MINWVKSKFTKHDYQYSRTSDTDGTYYKCVDCGRELYVPLYCMIDKNNIKGCKRTR